MQPHRSFIRFAAICCFATVITTLGIHVYFPDPPSDFEQRALMHKNTVYLINRWWVIVHCLLVLVAMWGFAFVQWKHSAATAGLGFVFFAVFAFAEVTRQLFVLFCMNELREQYATVTNTNNKENLRQLLTYAGLLTAPLFGLFILSFGLGNLCYGVSLWNERGFGKWLSILLLLWATITITVFANSFLKSEAINSIVAPYNYTFQPLLRLLLGIWLWKKAALIIEGRLKPISVTNTFEMQVG